MRTRNLRIIGTVYSASVCGAVRLSASRARRMMRISMIASARSANSALVRVLQVSRD